MPNFIGDSFHSLLILWNNELLQYFPQKNKALDFFCSTCLMLMAIFPLHTLQLKTTKRTLFRKRKLTSPFSQAPQSWSTLGAAAVFASVDLFIFASIMCNCTKHSGLFLVVLKSVILIGYWPPQLWIFACLQYCLMLLISSLAAVSSFLNYSHEWFPPNERSCKRQGNITALQLASNGFTNKF